MTRLKNTCPSCCVAVINAKGNMAACDRPSVHRNRCLEHWAEMLHCSVDEARERFWPKPKLVKP